MFGILRSYGLYAFGAAAILVLAALFYFIGFGIGAPEEATAPQRLPAIVPPPATPPSPKASASAEALADTSEGTAPPTRLIAPYQGETITLLNPDPAVAVKVPEARLKKFHDDLAQLAASVAANPLQPEHWLSIGFIKKFFNNYSGTRDAWEYAKLVDPRDSRIWYNLGTLYASYLKQPELAEANLKEAIRLDPGQVNGHTALADLYRYATPPQIIVAIEVISSAIRKLPNDPSLHTYLAELYVSRGEPAKAIAEYERAFTLLSPSDAALKSAIESALVRLRQ